MALQHCFAHPILPILISHWLSSSQHLFLSHLESLLGPQAKVKAVTEDGFTSKLHLN